MIYDKDIIQKIRDRFIAKHLTLAVAESVTSGHLQAAISCAPDASQFYQGGITVYNAGQKYRHLLVDPIHALACDSVSKTVAETMALNVCKAFLSNVGIAITGYAAPVPEQGITELYAFYAIAVNDKVIVSKKIKPTVKEPFDVQVYYTNTVLQSLSTAKW